MINVVNKYRHTPTDVDVYIGRGSVLGNPYTGTHNVAETKALYQCNSREESIDLYKDYLMDCISKKDRPVCDMLNKIWMMAKVGNVNLVCYCSPKECHGDIIKKLIESKL